MTPRSRSLPPAPRLDSPRDSTRALTAAAVSFVVAVEMMYCFRSMVAHQISFYEGVNLRMEAEQDEERKLLEQAQPGQAQRPSVRLSSGHDAKRVSFVRRQETAQRSLAERHEKAACHEETAQPLLLWARVWSAVQQSLWQVMAVAIMLVGVGVKLAIYDPEADAHAHFGLALRMMVGVALAAVFTLQMLYSMVIRRRQHYRRPLALLASQPLHCAVVLLQLLALVTAVWD